MDFHAIFKQTKVLEAFSCWQNTLLQYTMATHAWNSNAQCLQCEHITWTMQEQSRIKNNDNLHLDTKAGFRNGGCSHRYDKFCLQMPVSWCCKNGCGYQIWYTDVDMVLFNCGTEWFSLHPHLHPFSGCNHVAGAHPYRLLVLDVDLVWRGHHIL